MIMAARTVKSYDTSTGKYDSREVSLEKLTSEDSRRHGIYLLKVGDAEIEISTEELETVKSMLEWITE